MKKLYQQVVKFEMNFLEDVRSEIIEEELIEVTNEYVLWKDKTKQNRSFNGKKFILDLDEVSEDIPALEVAYVEEYSYCDSSDAFRVKQGFIYDDEKDDAKLIKSKAEIVKNNCTKLYLHYADEQIKLIKKAKRFVKKCPYRMK